MVENKYFVTDSHCHIYPEKNSLARGCGNR